MVKRLKILVAVLALFWVGCGEDEVKTEPPTIVGASLECEDDIDEDYQVVSKVLIEITDADRDLVATTIKGTVNGLMMEEFTDPDADERYEWIPSGAFDPPMVCRGEFTIIVEASDLEGQTSRETLVISP